MSLEIVVRIRALARLHGWAIGEHGTMVRDIDLVAVPWTEEASTSDVLVSAIGQVLGLELIGDPQNGYLTNKPHGRRAGSFQSPGTRMVAIVYQERGASGKCAHSPPHIDLSFVDPRLTPAPAAAPASRRRRAGSRPA